MRRIEKIDEIKKPTLKGGLCDNRRPCAGGKTIKNRKDIADFAIEKNCRIYHAN